MISLEEARRHVLDSCRPLAPERRSLRDALGCVTTEPIVATEAVPPFDNTAVDGYAVVAADTEGANDTPVELAVLGVLAAGHATDVPVQRGQALRIMTGAPMPPGADAVVMVEDSTELDGGTRVRLAKTVQPGDAVRRSGSDVTDGELVFPAGTILGPAHLGVLASIGVLDVLVVPPPRVGVISTGDELVEGGRALAPGEIRESNRTMLLGLVARAGAVPVDLGLVRDDEAAITATIARAVETCDAVITSGGVSMGDYDLIKVVLDQMGRMRWMQIAIKPAKPFAFGVLTGPDGDVPVFGLPGNPVSSLVSFELLARPALRLMAGHDQIDRVSVVAVADEPIRRHPDGKLHAVRVHGGFEADGRFHVRTTGPQGSHQLAATAAANALAMVPDGDGVPVGGPVRTILLWVA